MASYSFTLTSKKLLTSQPIGQKLNQLVNHNLSINDVLASAHSLASNDTLCNITSKVFKNLKITLYLAPSNIEITYVLVKISTVSKSSNIRKAMHASDSSNKGLIVAYISILSPTKKAVNGDHQIITLIYHDSTFLNNK